MSREHPGIGNLIQALSLKMNDMQREIAGLRQDVRTLTHLVRQLQSKDQEHLRTEQDAVEEDEQ